MLTILYLKHDYKSKIVENGMFHKLVNGNYFLPNNKRLNSKVNILSLIYGRTFSTRLFETKLFYYYYKNHLPLF